METQARLDNSNLSPDEQPFLITRSHSLRDLLRALSPFNTFNPCVLSNSPQIQNQIGNNWQVRIYVAILYLLHLVARPLKRTGQILEWFLNFLLVNGGVIESIFKLASFKGVTWPQKGSSSFFSIGALTDLRLNLMDRATALYKDASSKSFVDLCIMAAKLSYESEAVQKDVLANQWNMSFQKFYECWNDRTNRASTNAFVFMDKPHDAELVFVAFRGTQPFDASDWSTDFDFSWYELDPEVGKIHTGFLEALGLVNRKDPASFERFKRNCEKNTTSGPQRQDAKITTGLTTTEVPAEKDLAFDSISRHVGDLLQKNPRAKLYLTGHSLGGALAILFAGILMYKKNRDAKDEKILEKLAAIHTIGQPRVGDVRFAEFMDRNLETNWKVEYYRIVYCNDLVPRLPFDDDLFGFKHFGKRCCFFDSFYREVVLDSEPNKNFFSPPFFISMFPIAVWELLQGWVFVWLRFGDDFRENKLMMLVRVFGLIIPGLISHFPVNYVNSVRLGPSQLH